MRTIPSALATARAARGGIECDTLFWITARDRTTGVAESVGLWTGEDRRRLGRGRPGLAGHPAGNGV